MPKPLTLVTGATGLLGNNVARMLIERDCSVRVFAQESSDPRPLEGLDVEIVRGDLRNADDVRKACEGVDRVVHSAGLVQIGRSRLDQHRAVNVEGTRHIAQAARENGAKLVHVSTCDLIDCQDPETPMDETAPWADAKGCAYAVSKREGEEVVQEQIQQGLDAVIVNPGYMLGPWDWKPSSGRMLLVVARSRGWFAPRGQISLCDVRDVADGILAAFTKGKVGARYFLCGSAMSYMEAWRLFAKVTGGRPPCITAGPLMLIIGGSAGDLWTRLTGREPLVNSAAVSSSWRSKNFSSERAKEELGYKNRPAEETVRDAWEWFQENGYAKGK
jgi:dihydroflavonol-4-reductase